MSEKVDICEVCCTWVRENRDTSPATIASTYPKMMQAVLMEKFHMSKKAAKCFVREACSGNWDKIHETRLEKELDAETLADALVSDVWYCSDRWSWDRVMRVQWLYMRVNDRCERHKWRVEGIG